MNLLQNVAKIKIMQCKSLRDQMADQVMVDSRKNSKMGDWEAPLQEMDSSLANKSIHESMANS